MQTSHPTRPVTSIRPQPAAPQPHWDRIFLEPQYADGLPYDTTAGAPTKTTTSSPPPDTFTAVKSRPRPRTSDPPARHAADHHPV